MRANLSAMPADSSWVHIRGAVIVLAVSLSLALTGCEKYALDRKMEELCAKDAGLRIYESVKLPPKFFDSTGRLIAGPVENRGGGNFAQSVADLYTIESKDEIIKPGDPFTGMISEGRLLRHKTVVRKAIDGKLLAEEVTYSRTGGDITLGHPSQNFCPRPRPQPGIVAATFLKGE